MFFVNGGSPLRLPFGFNICSDSDLIHLGVSVISEHFQDVWESNENDRSSSQQKGHIHAHAQKERVLAPQSCPTLQHHGLYAEEPEIKFPTSAGPSKKQKCYRKTSTFASLTMPKPLIVWITTNLWKILKEMGIPDHLTCLLRNLYAGQEATVRTGHGTTDWFQIGEGVNQGCIFLPCLFNFYAEYIIWNAGLDEAQAGIKIAGRNINNLRYADDTTLWQKVRRN